MESRRFPNHEVNNITTEISEKVMESSSAEESGDYKNSRAGAILDRSASARFYRFLVQSSGHHLLRFQDIQGRFTVSKSK